jgi:hypothetical protein
MKQIAVLLICMTMLCAIPVRAQVDEQGDETSNARITDHLTQLDGTERGAAVRGFEASLDGAASHRPTFHPHSVNTGDGAEV